jgi:hypothetical protein
MSQSKWLTGKQKLKFKMNPKSTLLTALTIGSLAYNSLRATRTRSYTQQIPGAWTKLVRLQKELGRNFERENLHMKMLHSCVKVQQPYLRCIHTYC